MSNHISDAVFAEHLNKHLTQFIEAKFKACGVFDVQTQPMNNSKTFQANVFPHIQHYRIGDLELAHNQITNKEPDQSFNLVYSKLLRDTFGLLSSVISPEKIPFITKEYLDAMAEKMDQDNSIVLLSDMASYLIFGYKSNNYTCLPDTKLYKLPCLSRVVPNFNVNDEHSIYIIRKNLVKLYVYPIEIQYQQQTNETYTDCQFKFEFALNGFDYIDGRFIPQNTKERQLISCEFPIYKNIK